jgi:DNA polymerase III epsilon subunit-like protein
MSEWNDRQLDFINRPLSSGRLLGVPGGGKTRCLLGRILRLVDDGEIPASNGFLVLAFSNLAVRDFLRKGHELRPGVFTKTNVRTIHSVSGAVVSGLLGRTSSSINTVVYRACREIERRTADELRAKVACLRNARAVFVDEAQDLSGVQYALSESLSEKLGAPLCLVGDPNQSIYAFQNGSDRYLREFRGFSVSLTQNYRSSPEIVAAVEGCKPVPGDPIVAVAPPSGRRPEVFCDSQEDVSEDIVSRCRAALARRGETVAVIGPVRKSVVRSDGRLTNIGLTSVAAALVSADIPFLVHYKEDSDSESAAAAGDSCDADDPGRVHLLTLHKAKGLEFDTVLAVNFHYATMGREPAANDLGGLRCLWYVAMSRARRSLTMYCESGRAVWPGYEDVAHLFDAPRREPKLPKIRAPSSPDPISFAWTGLLKDRVRLPEEALAALEDGFAASVVRISELPEEAAVGGELPEEAALSSLYGTWAEETYAHAYRGAAPPILRWARSMLGAVVVPRGLLPQLRQLRESLGASSTEPLRWSQVSRHRQAYVGKPAMKIVEFLEANRPESSSAVDDVYIHADTDLIFWDREAVEKLVRDAESGPRVPLETMWLLCLLKWQYRNECAYRWTTDVARFVEALRPFHALVGRMAAAQPDGLEFQVAAAMPLSPVHGVADAVSRSRRRLIELKFSGLDAGGASHAVQALGYAEMLGGRRPELWTVEVHNLRTGEEFRVDRGAGDRWSVAKIVARATGKKIAGAVWLYDLETTGLCTASCGIIEVHMEEYNTGIVPLSTLVCQASVPQIVTDITGIDAGMLSGRPSQAAAVADFAGVLEACESPVLVAHNGLRFDHEIMKRLGAVPRGTVLRDTLHLLPLALFGGKAKGERKTLSSIYEKVFGGPFEGAAHRAEADVEMMRRLMDEAGFGGNCDWV